MAIFGLSHTKSTEVGNDYVRGQRLTVLSTLMEKLLTPVRRLWW